MKRSDALLLPDGRVMPYRRAGEAPARRTAGRGLAVPRAQRRRDRRRRPRSNADCGRNVDLLV